MSGFRASIIAELDPKKIPSQLESFSNKYTLELKKIRLDTKGLPSQIQASLDKHKFTINLDGIKTDNIEKQGDDVGQAFSSALTSRIKKQLENGGIEASIAKVTAQYEKLGASGHTKLNDIKKDIIELGRLQGQMRNSTDSTMLVTNYTEYNNVLQKVRNSLITVAAESKNINISTLSKAQEQIGKIHLEIVKLQSQGGNVRQIEILEKQLEEIETSYSKLIGKFWDDLSTPNLSFDDLQELESVIAASERRIEQFNAKLADTQQRTAKNIQVDIDEGKLTTSVTKVESQFEKLKTSTNADLSEIAPKLKELRQLTDMLGDTSSMSADEIVASYQKWQSVLSTLTNSLNTAQLTAKNLVSVSKIQSLDSEIGQWLKNNSAATKEFGSDIYALRNRLHELVKSGNATEEELEEIAIAFASVKYQAQQAGLTGASFGKQLSGAFKSIMRYISVSTIIYQASNAVKQMYHNVVDINTAMTELKKVTDESDRTYDAFLDNAGDKAQELGVTVKDIVASTADFARLGYSLSDAENLAEVANIYAVVGDDIESIDEASQSLVSTMAAFRISANDAITIVDKFNEVSNNFAISSGGIGEALQRSASSLAAANNTISQSIALITSANTVIQDEEVVGKELPT